MMELVTMKMRELIQRQRSIERSKKILWLIILLTVLLLLKEMIILTNLRKVKKK